MKKQFARLGATVLIVGLIFTGCDKKEKQQESTQAPTSNTVTTVTGEDAAAYKLSAELSDEEKDAAYRDAQCTRISFNGSSIETDSAASVSGTTVSITKAGTYLISGTLDDGQIYVNSTEKGSVRLIFAGVTISNATTAPVYIEEADEVIITLADNTVNIVTDKARASTELEELSAAIYSKADLCFNGSGTLEVRAGYNDGITSKDDLKVVDGIYQITSADDGIVGKDLLQITGGDFCITAGGDGMKSTYDTDTAKGNILITAGNFTVTAGNDGIQSENILQVDGGTFEIVTGGGVSTAAAEDRIDFNPDGYREPMGNMDGNVGGGMTEDMNNSGIKGDRPDRGFGRGDDGGSMGGKLDTGNPEQSNKDTSATTDTTSTKGIKAVHFIGLYDGTIIIDGADDSIHSNGSIYIANGMYTLRSGDDGIHADGNVTVENGTITVEKSYEGIEGQVITVNGGVIDITASDDGFNAAGGDSVDSFSMGRPGTSQQSDSYQLVINGGQVHVNAAGDGLDSNGSITVNGGEIYVDGPTGNGDTAVDYETACTVNGGILIAVGSSGMVEGISAVNSGVTALSVDLANTYQAGSVIKLTDQSGKTVVSYIPQKAFSNIMVASASIGTGDTYQLYINESLMTTFTTVGTINTVSADGSVSEGNSGGFMGGGFGGGGGMRR